jgi:hypothetical protein
MAVEAVGAGFYVRAHVVTRLALSCDCCLATFEQPVDTHFEVRGGICCCFCRPKPSTLMACELHACFI